VRFIDAALVEEPRQHPVDDRGPHLRLDVVADDRQPGLLETRCPVVLLGNEHRDAVHEAAARLEDLLHIPLGGLLRAHRQVGDDHVGLRLLEDAHDVVGLPRRLRDLLLEVLAEAVVRHAAVDRHAQAGDVGELDGVVLARPDRLGEVLADLVGVDVEGGAELDVGDVVAAEVHVHQAGDGLTRIGVLVELHALDQRGRAVAHADDRDAHLVALVARAAV
jgi:hypothetical protein